MFFATHEIAPIAVNGWPSGREFGPYIIEALDIKGALAALDVAWLKNGAYAEI